MIAWNGHGFEVVAVPEEEELRRQEAEIAELIRRHRQRGKPAPEEKAEIDHWNRVMDERIRQLSEADVAQWETEEKSAQKSPPG